MRGVSAGRSPRLRPASARTRYQLIAIGEAVGEVSQASRDSQSCIPWSRIKGMRNLLTHRYHDIDPSVVAQVVDSHLAQLETAVRELLADQPRS